MAINSPYRTSSDLVMRVLEILGIISVGEPIDPEDFSKVNNNLDSIYRKLGGLEIVYVADPDNIPGAWFEDVAAIVAGEVASSFGLVGQEMIDKVNGGLGGAAGTQVPIGAGTSAQSLKIMGRGRPTFEPLRIMNF